MSWKLKENESLKKTKQDSLFDRTKTKQLAYYSKFQIHEGFLESTRREVLNPLEKIL